MAYLFKQLSEDMERVAQVVEEGAKFMMGETTHMGEQGSDATFDPTTGGSDGYDGQDEDAIFDDMDGGSPLMGMADSVMSDIMSTQVGAMCCFCHLRNSTCFHHYSRNCPLLNLLSLPYHSEGWP